MKTKLKIISIILATTIFTGCNKTSEPKEISTNQFFEYSVPQSWTNSNTYSDFTEISIREEEGNSWFLMEYQDEKVTTKTDFINAQKQLIEEQPGVKFEEEKSGKINDKTIETVTYKLEDNSSNVKFIFGTIQFKGKEDFLGFVGLLDDENKEKEIIEFFENIEPTNKKFTDKTKFVAEKDYIELTLPAGWRRVNGDSENYFYKITKNGNLQLRVSIMDNDIIKTEDFFEKEIESFEKTVNGVKLSSENKEEKDGRTIQSKIYTFTQNDKPIYVSFNLISTKNSSLSIVANFKVDVKENFEEVKPEIEEMIQTLKFKKDGEQKFKEDLQKLQQEIQDFNKYLEENPEAKEQFEKEQQSQTETHNENDGHEH